ncbi:MAG TPA: hypothetical protein VJM47_07710 [Nitrosospira sp.]|nr:hypothetical protein [Nitrosospira sp.]
MRSRSKMPPQPCLEPTLCGGSVQRFRKYLLVAYNSRFYCRTGYFDEDNLQGSV